MRAIVNRIPVAYTDEGEGSPLVLVHGFPLSRGAWSKQVAAFSPAYRVIAPDLRGFGETEATGGSTPMSRFAADLYALLQHLDTGPVLLVGHSMGGYVALAFAHTYPQMLRRLVLVGTKAGADSPEAAAARHGAAEKVRTEGPSSLVEGMASKMLSPHRADAALAADVRGLMEPAQPQGLIGALLGMAERPDARGWLEEIRVPTLVVAGADDAVIPVSESESLAQAIPGAQLRLIPGAGHLVAFEAPEAFNAALGTWLTSALP